MPEGAAKLVTKKALFSLVIRTIKTTMANKRLKEPSLFSQARGPLLTTAERQ